MRMFEFKGKRYEPEADEFLHDSLQWDEDFARDMAVDTGNTGSLSESHWGVISLIRDRLAVTGMCPKVYDIRRAQHLHISNPRQLFPAGSPRES